MKEIQLSQQGQNKDKYIALVDDEDFEELNKFKWHAKKDGNTLYAMRKIRVDNKGKNIFMHIEIMGKRGIDHRDHNGLNNQKSNLRFCTPSENAMNARKNENSSSVYKGVCFFNRDKKWLAQIQVNGKPIRLGCFASEVEAAKAYNAKAIELFCEFANLNVIPNK